MGDFETLKYDVFFNENHRTKEENKEINIKNVINEVFDFIYKGKYSNILFSHPKSYEENPVLKKLFENAPISKADKNSKNCNDVFYEYLCEFKEKKKRKIF